MNNLKIESKNEAALKNLVLEKNLKNLPLEKILENIGIGKNEIDSYKNARALCYNFANKGINNREGQVAISAYNTIKDIETKYPALKNLY